MSEDHHIQSNRGGVSSLHTSDFFFRFKENLVKELLLVLSVGVTVYAYVAAGLYGIILFLLEIKELRSVIGYVLLPFLIYYFGKYLTLLPISVVIFLIFLPGRITWPILGLSAFFSFFLVFMV